MNVKNYLDALHEMPVTTVAALTGSKPFVVLSPHPDDESLGLGGLIAEASAAGQQAEVVVITDGSKSHPNSREYPRDRLIALRKGETTNAARALGLLEQSVTHLGLPDTKVPLAGPSFDHALSQIAKIIRRSGALTLFATWPYDPHCDHHATAHIACTLRAIFPTLTVWFYPIWGWHLDPLFELGIQSPKGARIDISAQKNRKHAAILAHESQITDLINDDDKGFRFTDHLLAPFLGPFEYVIAADA